jgi:hypothetical protein
MTLPFGTLGEKVHDASSQAADTVRLCLIRDRFIFISLRI